LPAGEAVALAVQACSGLDHAHAAGLVHRDVKPGNLLVRPDGTLKIGDFGIARATAATSLTEAGTILGTAAYLSPEQAAGEEVTAAADLYALGSVLYELLTGRPSRTIDSLERLVYQADAEPIAPVRDLAPDVPTALEDVVMRTLARRPEHRPGSAAALARELEAALPDSVAPASDAVTEVLRSRHSVDTELQHGAGVHRPRHRWTPALVAAILVVAAIVVAILLVSGGDGGGADPARVEPVEPASDPEQQARNLAEWLREHS
jgi:serine/threonine-protein kinase